MVQPPKRHPLPLSSVFLVRDEGLNLSIMAKLLIAVVEVPYELLTVYEFPGAASIPVVRDMERSRESLGLVHNEGDRRGVNAIHAGGGSNRRRFMVCSRRGRYGTGDRRHGYHHASGLRNCELLAIRAWRTPPWRVMDRRGTLRFGEVPVNSVDRLYGGKSTAHPVPWTGEYMRWFLWGFQHRHRVPKSSRPTVRVRPASAFPSRVMEK
jgi:hypothetical protein